MLKKFLNVKCACLFILFFTFVTCAIAQVKPGSKPAAGVKGKPANVKATLAADMDCTVKINGSAKLISVKAYTPYPVTINVGKNTVECVSADKKSTYNTVVEGKPGEPTIVEISFFDDSKFLDYIKLGNVGMVEKAITKDPALVKNENQSLTTSPLEIAIQNSQVGIVKLLLDKGASFTSPDNIYPLHKSALHASSMIKGKEKMAPDKELVDIFLSKGCKVSDKDDGGNTPLHSAVRGKKLELVVFFLELGANVNAKNDFDDTPLSIAEDKGLVSIIEFLKSKGALEKKPVEQVNQEQTSQE